MADDAVSLRKSHDIVILSFCNILKGQANCTNKNDLVLDPVLVDPPFSPP